MLAELTIPWQPLTATQRRVGREILIARLEQLDPSGDGALLLGGTDSTTLLFALLEMGRKPHCYTFHIQGIEAPDVVVAQKLAATFGFVHTPVPLPAALTDVWKAVYAVLPLIDWTLVPQIKKTIVQTVYPMHWAFSRIDAPFAFTGSQSDVFLATTRKERILLDAVGEDLYNLTRIPSGLARPDETVYHIDDVVRRVCGKAWLDPYACAEWAAWMQQFPVRVCHSPHQKAILTSLFKEYWKRGRFYRVNSPYHIGTGIRGQQDGLLLDPGLNPKGHRAVIAIYRDMARMQGLTAQVGTGLRRAEDLPAPPLPSRRATGLPDERAWVALRDGSIWQHMDEWGLCLDRSGCRLHVPTEADRERLAHRLGLPYVAYPSIEAVCDVLDRGCYA